MGNAAAWTAELALWLLGVAALIGSAVYPLSRLIRWDSYDYDRTYVWIGYREELDRSETNLKPE
ncbi:hypothetical protein HGI30_13235 [Paenibacillus albicereus]|uniref:Uncharacterized protein n=1 Tax=Paenibacillus albicereus TaxID=2726185 RepID=A0A6H2GYC1_9BACL|nr:hypothetical protein [Paenibacillus albicereus]QJC52431.1 hypothetical protein HGI30_13235 [Paenibacillus albicereus]